MNYTKTIFEYDSYREFLREELARRKKRNKNYSIRNFARMAGFQSHSFVIFVLNGTKNLSDEAIEKFAQALKLNKDEKHYFKHLVLLNQAGNTSEKALHTREILRSRAYRKIYPLKESQMHYFTRWYFIVVREMVNLPEFTEDPKWIANRASPPITPAQAQEAVEELLKLGLLSRDAGGRLVQDTPVISSPDEVMAPFMAELHREFMRRASEAIDRIPRENRDLSFVTFRMSEKTARKFKEKIQKFRKELAEEASRDSQPDAIFQLNLQLFPVTQLASQPGRKDKRR